MHAFDFNLRHLRAFVAATECGSLTAAAHVVNLSQSAITQAIAKLELQIELPLFERQASGVIPTHAATLLLPRARRALELVASNRVTASQVRAFVSVAKHGSYVATAAETGLRQPSLHRSVAQLSATLGQSLFDRRGRGIVLTRRGQAAATRFQLAEAELRAAIAELEGLKGREVGRIVIGAMPLCRARLLPRVIAAFHEIHPEAGVTIVEGSFTEIVGPLRAGEIDLVLGALRDHEGSDLEQRPLFVDRPIIVGRHSHPLARVGEPTSAQLAQYPWIVASEGTPLRDRWRHLFGDRADGPPNVALESGSVIIARQLLIDDDFLTLLSPDQVAIDIESGTLAQIGTAREGLSRTIGMISRAAWRPTKMQQAFVDLVIAQSEQMGTTEAYH